MSSETISSRDRYSEYDTWAWLYNETMGPQYCRNQVQPLERILLPLVPSNARILDVCCGTGHLVQTLIEKGYQVTGLDGSEQMLKYAQQNAPQGQFILADARTFTIDDERNSDINSGFDAVFSTSASLNHIMSIPELKMVFQSVYAALKYNGIFFFDINHHQQMQRWWRGKIVEGEIKSTYAWTLIPKYEPTERQGYFQVTMFQGGSTSKFSLTRKLYQLLSLILNKFSKNPILYKLHLKLLTAFHKHEQDWQQMYVRYPVRGHQPEEIKTALAEVGFLNIDIRTLEGYTTIDDRHSVYFICRK